ncbi:50S ribosomal protein L24e [Candidatus Woesearchaeota archaeon]|nr:50S ribosomal protein L24e [Candidatus Woesearchaeota archaeon]
MVKCSFCGKELEKGTGWIYVRVDGSILNFDSRKCRMYMLKLKKNPRKLKWTSSFAKGQVKVSQEQKQ